MASRTAIAAAGLGIVAMVAGSAAQAFNFGNMMNPSRWFNDRDRDRDYYGGYGGGPYGYGGPGGWGGPGYGYGAPVMPYAAPVAPVAPAAPAPAQAR